MNLLGLLTAIDIVVCVLWPAYGREVHPESARGREVHPESARGRKVHPESARGREVHPESARGREVHPESARGCNCNGFASSLGNPASCTQLEHKRGFATAKHTIIIGLDGLGSLYLENATSFLPNIASFFAEGSTTLRGRAQMPTWSAPNWAAVITGMGPEESGIQYNTWLPPQQDKPSNSTAFVLPPISGAGKIPKTMWRVAKEQNGELLIAVAHAWDWIHFFVEPDTVDMEHCPHLMFLHLVEVDSAGHAHYWGSPEYYAAAKKADGYVGRVLEALAQARILNDTLVMVTADHGGYHDNHGDFNEANIFIPVLLRGPGVRQGHTLSSYISNRDLAPTALHALGLLPGRYMVGRVLEEAFK